MAGGYAGRAEADDVGSPIGVNVSKRAWVKVVAGPAAGAGTGTEGRELEGWCPEVAVSRGPGHVHTGRAEANDVGHAVTGYVAAPTAGHGAEGGKLERGHREVGQAARSTG